MKKPSVEELRQILHNEQMSGMMARIKKQRILDDKLPKACPDSEYINTLRKANIPIPLTEIAKATNPKSNQLGLEYTRQYENLMNAKGMGHVHGLCRNTFFIAILWFIYVFL